MPAKRKKAKSTFVTYEHVRSYAGTAAFFGFSPEKISITEKDRKASRGIERKEDPGTEEKTALLRVATERGAQGGQPLMTYREKDDRGGTTITLHVIGNGKGVGEALVIGTARAILSDAGLDNNMVVVNGIGDKDSNQRFIRAVTEYYRRNIDVLHPTCRQLMRKNMFAVMACTHEKCKELAESAPRSMNFLTESSRFHFKEVLEYLDASNIPYTISDTLLPSKNYASHTVFNIISTDEKNPETYAEGCRYNALSRRLGNKRELSAVGISIFLDKKHAGEIKKKIRVARAPFFFIHVGTEARLRSIGLLDSLRKEGIPVSHAIIKDKLPGQLVQAEEMRTPYILLMGQRECIDDSIMVRNTENRSQKSVKIVDLATYLKKLL